MSSHVLGNHHRNLYRVLRRAQNAWWKTTVWTILLAALALSALAIVALWLYAWWTGEPGSLVGRAGVLRTSVPWTAAGTMGVVLVAGLLLAAWLRPSPLELARRLDHRLGLSQRLSTAYEVAEAGGPANVVELALLQEVEAHRENLDVRPAGRSRALVPLVRAALATVVLATVAILLPVPLQPMAGTVVSSSGSSQSLPEATDVATVTELAQILDLVAERSQNDYLKAVAGSFAEFSASLASGEVSAAEAARTSQELAEHLMAAAGDVGGAFQQAIEGALGGALADGAQSTPLGGAGVNLEAGAADVGAAQAGAASNDTASEEAPSVYMAFDKVVAEYEYDPSSLGLRSQQTQSGDGGSNGDIYGGVMNAQTDPDAAAPEAPFAGRVQGQGGGEVAGAAERSNEGAGDAAGAGGAELGAGLGGPVAEAEAASIAALPRNESVDGAFTEVELLPATTDGPLRLALEPDSPMVFTRTAESSSGSRAIGSTYKDVIARYFTPTSKSTGPGR